MAVHLRRGCRRFAWCGGVLTLGSCLVLAGGVSAAPAPTVFTLTLTGTAHHEWSHTTAPVENGDCVRTEMSEGIRTTRFRTKEPVVVRLLGGRVLPADVRGLMGTATLAGANTIDERCGNVGNAQIADCAQTRRSFSGARVRASSPRRGFVGLGAARGVRLAASDCPLEPVEVRRRPFGPPLSPLRIPKNALTEAKVASITMKATRTATTTYSPPEAGTLEERVEWKLNFARVRP